MPLVLLSFFFFFFFNDTATTEIYTLSLHDALPICRSRRHARRQLHDRVWPLGGRSEEHTSELQSRLHLVCRLLLEKKKKQSRAHAVNDGRAERAKHVDAGRVRCARRVGRRVAVLAARHPRADVVKYFFFFNDTATTEIYTLSLHDALPI